MNVSPALCRIALELHLRSVVRGSPIEHDDGEFVHVYKPRIGYHVSDTGTHRNPNPNRYRVVKSEYGNNVVYNLPVFVVEQEYTIYHRSDTQFVLYGGTKVYPLVVKSRHNHTKYMTNTREYRCEYYLPARKSYYIDVAEPDSFEQTTQFVCSMLDTVRRYFI